MDFKAYAEQKLKETHKEIILDICMTVNNCADCHNDETRQIECNPLNCVELHKVSKNQFYMESYDSKTNKQLIEIAEDHGYKAGFIIKDSKTVLKFWKEEYL